MGRWVGGREGGTEEEEEGEGVFVVVVVLVLGDSEPSIPEGCHWRLPATTLRPSPCALFPLALEKQEDCIVTGLFLQVLPHHFVDGQALQA